MASGVRDDVSHEYTCFMRRGEDARLHGRFIRSVQVHGLLRQQVLQALEQADVLVQPTAGLVAQKVEPDPIIDSKTKTNRLSWLLTTTYSLANVPALSIPCGFPAPQGGTALPIGLQIAGKPFAEVTVFKVAHAYEQQTPWLHQRPPL
jgi:aspartyl-tRNA(Asn)/glutamyl-tRNA(Gln) amidotransferase subunit A